MGMIRADRIRERMEELGLSQLSAAKKAGLGQDYVRDILRGRIAEPSAHRLFALARALDCSPEFLIGTADELGAPPPPISQTAIADAATNLPVLHRLAEGVYRLTEDDRAEEAGTLYTVLRNPEYPDHPQWIARVEDDHAIAEIPPDYLVLVVDAAGLSESRLITRLAVVESFRDGGALVERTIRYIMPAGLNPIAMSIGAESRVIGAIDGRDLKIIGWVSSAFKFFAGGRLTSMNRHGIGSGHAPAMR